MKLHVAGMAVDRPVGSRAVDDDGGIGGVSGFETRKAAVACDLVLQNELKDEVAVESHALLHQRLHQPQADGDTRFVIHGATTEDRVASGVDVAGERRMGPCAPIAFRLDVEMAVENERAAGTFSGQTDDNVVAARHIADRLHCVKVAA